MSRFGLMVVGVLLLGTARCPVGCRTRPMPRGTWAPAVDVPIEQIGPCQFRPVRGLPVVKGIVACHIDDESAIPDRHWTLDGGILTITEEGHCSPDAGTPKVELVFYEEVPLGGPE